MNLIDFFIRHYADNPAMVNSDNDSHGCGSSQSNHTSIPEAQPFPKVSFHNIRIYH